MKIAIIGAGISGLTAAYHLRHDHQITVLEGNSYVGGHTNTIDVEESGKVYAVDTGFIVFNYRTYPNFKKMLDALDVASQPTSMTFSVKCDRTGLEYRGADLPGFFAQRRNLFRPRYYVFLRDMLRFNRLAQATLVHPAAAEETLTVREFFDRHPFSQEFIEHYFLPMGSAVWSCPRGVFMEFPIRFIVEFYKNHGMLAVQGRPQWRVIQGGSRQYVGPLTAQFAEALETDCPVTSVRRVGERVKIQSRRGEEMFDHVIFACHSDQALQILGDTATATERELLGAFPYEENVTLLHTDTSVLPVCRRAWAAWNYHVPQEDTGKATVTYNMNILQGLSTERTYCVTLNGEDRIDPAKVIRRMVYHHPVFTAQRAEFQRRHGELIDHHGISYCGAYWGNGFHEDGVNSALAVCSQLSGAPRQELGVQG